MKKYWDLSDQEKLEYELLQIIRPQQAKSWFKNDFPDRDINQQSEDLRLFFKSIFFIKFLYAHEFSYILDILLSPYKSVINKKPRMIKHDSTSS